MSQVKPVRKAVFPVAGMGTRFLPATKSIPKEMLPIVDKPLIQYAVEEALEAGIETLIFITSRKKHSISDHFDRAHELETRLAEDGKSALLDKITEVIPENVSRAHVPQIDPRGLGHAVLCAKSMVGNEPFAVLLADDMIKAQGEGCLKQMVDVYQRSGANLLAVQQVASSQTNRYGIVDTQEGSVIGLDAVSRIKGIVEKPRPEDAPSNLGVVGRYILNPEVFDCLENTAPGAGGEIQLTDAIGVLLQSQHTYSYAFDGIRYDCGSKIGFVKATVDYAIDHEDMRDELIQFVEQFIQRQRNAV